MGESNIDVTLTTNDLLYCIDGWNVLDVNDSEQRVITFDVHIGSSILIKSNDIKRFNINKANWSGYLSNVYKLLPDENTNDIDLLATEITRAIQQAAKNNIPRLKPRNRR